MRSAKALLSLVTGFAVALLTLAPAFASGPRWVTGPPYFTGPGEQPIGWKQPQLLYFTDPAGLSQSVNHATADALVAAAAGVWNVPVASITVAQGGTLAEHVSGANVYVDSAGVHFPADVSSGNAAAIPLAVIYDSDGSVTEALLGAGASDPAECLQNGVTESVDSFDPAGYIVHAVLVVNGRCSGPVPAQQLQLRYQLERAFGRVLGLAWSQTNDNVFTGTPLPTSAEAQNWPILHPVDILCGAYTYQCLPNPFQLRIDDIAGLVAVYPVAATGGGKQASLGAAEGVKGFLYFPTLEGMAGVNMLVRRTSSTSVTDAFIAGSAVTGTLVKQNATSPFVAVTPSAETSFGDYNLGYLGFYELAYLPILAGGDRQQVTVSTEPVNPLYTGEYSLGPYSAGTVAPAGSAPVPQTSYGDGTGVVEEDFPIADAPSTCAPGADGTAAQPMQAPASGWWNGLLCGYGHASYGTANVQPGRSFTLEVTALDASGLATTLKAMPVLGLFAASDAPGSLPSLGVANAAFNGLTVGTTTLAASTGQSTTIRFGIADQRGDGRPDYNYQARLFYADTVTPAQVAASGGTITIAGLGFRTGNVVRINGVSVPVVSWSANTLVVAAPAAASVGASAGAPVDLVVADITTGATSTITGALTYSVSPSLPNSMRLLSAPAGTLLAGDLAATAFAVQVLAADGKTPVAGVSVTLSTLAGSVLFSACGAASCTLRTDANGSVSSSLIPSGTGTITLAAQAGALAQTASFNVEAQAGSIVLLSVPESPILDGNASRNWLAFALLAADGVTPIAGRSVTLSVPQGSASFQACNTAPCVVTTDGSGRVGMPVTPLSAGTIVLQIAAGDLVQTASFVGLTNADTMSVVYAPPATAYPGQYVYFGVQLLKVTGGYGDAGQFVSFSSPAAVPMDPCETSLCTLATNGGGVAAVGIKLPNQPGSYPLTATFSSGGQTLTQTVIAVVVATPPMQLKLVSTPADGSTTNVQAAAPFTMQLLAADGVTPIVNAEVILAGLPDTVTLSACGASTCYLGTDGNGLVTTGVTPLVPGLIALTARAGALNAATSFTAVGASEIMTIFSEPGSAGAAIGVQQPLAVRIFAADGVTPITNREVSFVVVSGPFAMTFFGQPTAIEFTDVNGIAVAYGQATGTGPVVLQATDGVATQLLQFNAGPPAEVLRLVSAPGATVTTGTVAATPFAVQVLAPDGVTPLAGVAVSFTATAGSVTFGGCAAPGCSVLSDTQGNASVTITPLAAGTVGLLASIGNVTAAASFTAVAPPDQLTLLSAPGSGGFVGDVAGTLFAVQALLPGNTAPAAGRSVTVSVTTGGAALGACGGAATCVLTTDAHGMVSTAVTPTAAGTVSLQAIDGSAVVTASFSALAKPDVLHLLAAPPGAVQVGDTNSFAVQLLLADGVTADPGKTIVFSVTAGAATFAACGAASCSLVTAQDGSARTAVTASGAGAVTIQAAVAGLTQVVTFVASAKPNVLTLVSAPASGAIAGTPAATPFAVVETSADGVTPAAGRKITVSVTNGSATLGACSGATSCSVTTDALGRVSTPVTPTAAGMVTLLATDGALSASATFSAAPAPDTMRLVSAPTGSQGVGVAASPGFSVQLFQADGKTPEPGKTIRFSVAAGSAQIDSCGASVCSVLTAQDGTASTLVTPTAAGAVSLIASYADPTGTLQVTAAFTAVQLPDTLQLVSGPASGGYAGTPAALPFAVRVLLADGATPAAGRSVRMSVTNGSAALAACAGAAGCQLVADSLGLVSSAVTPGAAGSISLAVTDGTAVQTYSFTALAKPDLLQVVSAPGGNQPVGVVTAVPFRVQLLQGDGVTPDAGKTVAFSITAGSAQLQCGGATCPITTAQDGTATITVTPTAAGSIGLQAAYGTVLASASFTAVQLPDVLQLISGPASGGYVGAPAAVPFSVRILLADGVTPAAGRSVTLAITNGSASFAACAGAAGCQVVADPSGLVASTVTPLTAGAISLALTDATSVQSFTFAAIQRPDVLQLVSAPVGALGIGLAATPAFAVQVLQGDGVTPRANAAVVFSVSAGSARLAACGGASCTVLTDASGMAATAVTPLAPGPIALLATQGGLTVTAAFTAVQLPDVLQLVSGPASGGSTGSTAAAPFAVRILLADGSTPAAGRSVLLSVTNGSASFAACGAGASCQLTSDANGLVSTAVTPLSAGLLELRVTDGATMLPYSFSVIARPDTLQIVSTPQGSLPVGVVAAAPLRVLLLQADGVTPDPGRTITFAVVTGSAQWSGCAGASCTAVTAADGTASLGVTPSAAGVVTLQASYADAAGAVQVSTSFTAFVRPDSLTIVAVPSSGGRIGVPAGAFTVQVLEGDGLTPRSGQPVTISVAAGAADLSPCLAQPCVLTTGSDGRASVDVTPQSAGTITVLASAGPLSVSASFTVLANKYAAEALTPTLYLAEGAVATTTAQIQFTENGTPASGVAVSWTGAGGYLPQPVATVTDASGIASVSAILGPLQPGAQARLSACAWTSVCAGVTGVGVSNGALAVVLSSGTAQAATGGQALQPVAAQVQDAAGHPVVMATATVYQTVTALDVPCPARGRCPAAPILASQLTVTASDSTGQIEIIPIAIPGVATSTQITITAGTNGAASTVLTSQP